MGGVDKKTCRRNQSLHKIPNFKVISGVKMNINVLRSVHIFKFESNFCTNKEKRGLELFYALPIEFTRRVYDINKKEINDISGQNLYF